MIFLISSSQLTLGTGGPWYFVGRPTPDELRTTIRDLLEKSVPDANFSGD